MENKKKIPGYVFGIIGIVIVAIIFLFAVQVPFTKAQPELERQHKQDAAQLKIYEDAEADKENLKARVNSMKEQYEKDSEGLFINALQSPGDIMKMLKSSKTDPTSYKISEQKVDDKARQSSGGDLLYSTDINITYDSLDEEQIKSVLNYFESVSNGAYYVDQLNVAAIMKDSSGNAEPGSDESDDKNDDKEESSKTSSGDLTSLYYTGKYKVTVTLKLYYFLPPDQTPEALKAEQSAASQSADTTVSAPVSAEESGTESPAA